VLVGTPVARWIGITINITCFYWLFNGYVGVDAPAGVSLLEKSLGKIRRSH
jgi:hypothetical protein